MKAYIRSISRKAWFLIWVSVGYLLLIPLFCQWLSFEDALITAQLLYVATMCIPLLFPTIGKRVGLYGRSCESSEEKVKRKFLYVEAALASIGRFIADRRSRPVVPKAKSDDQVDPDLTPGKRGDL